MYKKLLLVLFLAAFLGVLFILPSRLIKIAKIECESQYGDCPKETVANLEKESGKNLHDAKIGVSRSLKDNLLISDYNTQLQLPNTLKVDLVIKKASFALKQKDTDNFTLIDKDGTVVLIVNSSQLPTVEIPSGLKNVGEKVEDVDLFSLKLIKGVSAMYQVNLGRVVNDTLVVELPQHLNVIFPLEGDTEVLLGALRAVVTKIDQDTSRSFHELDLRFRNPVLR